MKFSPLIRRRPKMGTLSDAKMHVVRCEGIIMRFFELLNLQDVILYVFPTLIFMLIFWLALAYRHFYSRNWQQRRKDIYSRYAEGLEDQNQPIPVAMGLIIAGTLLWAFFYILLHGLLEVKI